MNDDFDESILNNAEEFKKRFRRIERPAFIDKVIKRHKSRITIMLDPDVIDHFKFEAERSNVGYQTLINQALREKISESEALSKSDELIEGLLKNKNALRRLKHELETV